MISKKNLRAAPSLGSLRRDPDQGAGDTDLDEAREQKFVVPFSFDLPENRRAPDQCDQPREGRH